MAGEYDSILKEKRKTIQEPTTNNHPLLKKSIFIGIILSIIIIIISYVIYFNTVLASESIFLNNLLKITDKYSVLFEDITTDYSNINYNTSGTISIDNLKYNFHFTKEEDNIIKIFSQGNNYITYYSNGNTTYTTTSKLNNQYFKRIRNKYEIEDYQNKKPQTRDQIYKTIYNNLLEDNIFSYDDTIYNIESYYSIISEIKNNLININSNKYTKKVYLNNGKPIVLTNLKLNTEDLNKILNKDKTNLKLKDNYIINIDMKNNPITNEIMLIKVIINNKTKDTRSVINYDNKDITITDNDGNKDKISLEKNKTVVKYYKNEVLYSRLEKKHEENNLIYNYQIINEVYSIRLSKNTTENNYKYNLEFNINDKKNTITVEGTTETNLLEVPDVKNSINYNELTEPEKSKYNNSIKQILFSN